ncbi:MAG: Ig-like domain-containing protein, partial [Planctomycetaceae bacterium]
MLRRLTAEWIGSWVSRTFQTPRLTLRQRPRRQPAADALEPRLLLAAPVANPDVYSLPHDRAYSPFIGILQNDSDADRDPLTAQLVSSPRQGTVTLLANGQFTYVPNPGFLGTDQ